MSVGCIRKLKKTVAALLCHDRVGRLVNRWYGPEIPSHGCRINLQYPFVSNETRAAVFWGFYEAAEVAFVERHLPRDRDVVELGASLGVVSAHVARRLESGRRLVCVEANGRLLPCLKRNVSAAGPGVHAEFINAVVSYEEGTDRGFVVRGDHLASRLAQPSECASATEVASVTLGEVVARAGLEGFTLVTDIEGAEAAVFAMDGVVLNGCGLIIAELHDTEWRGVRTSVEDLMHAIGTLGFSLRERRGAVCAFGR